MDEETKSDVKNTIELFLKTYNDDITQARLLFLEPDRLLPLDDNTSLELNGMSDVTKSEDTYYVNCTLKQTVSEMQMILKYHFEIDIEKNKVKVMEGKVLSMLDEVIEGFVVLVIFCVIMANDASTVIGWVTTPLMWLINLIKTFFREVLGIPL